MEFNSNHYIFQLRCNIYFTIVFMQLPSRFQFSTSIYHTEPSSSPASIQSRYPNPLLRPSEDPYSPPPFFLEEEVEWNPSLEDR